MELREPGSCWGKIPGSIKDSKAISRGLELGYHRYSLGFLFPPKCLDLTLSDNDSLKINSMFYSSLNSLKPQIKPSLGALLTMLLAPVLQITAPFCIPSRPFSFQGK